MTRHFIDVDANIASANALATDFSSKDGGELIDALLQATSSSL